MFATILKLLAGLVTIAQSMFSEYDKSQNIQLGQLEEQAKEQTQKATDEVIANKIDALPVPADKHRIIDGM